MVKMMSKSMTLPPESLSFPVQFENPPRATACYERVNNRVRRSVSHWGVWFEPPRRRTIMMGLEGREPFLFRVPFPRMLHVVNILSVLDRQASRPWDATRYMIQQMDVYFLDRKNRLGLPPLPHTCVDGRACVDLDMIDESVSPPDLYWSSVFLINHTVGSHAWPGCALPLHEKFTPKWDGVLGPLKNPDFIPVPLKSIHDLMAAWSKRTPEEIAEIEWDAPRWVDFGYDNELTRFMGSLVDIFPQWS